MRRRGDGARTAAAVGVLATVLALLTGCDENGVQPRPAADPSPGDSVDPPVLGACRTLTLDEVAAPTNASPVVPCTEKHNTQTYDVGRLPPALATAAYDSPEVGAFAYRTCDTGLHAFLGADESLSMRTVLSWAWFRPSEEAWDAGARWYRCDVVGGGEQSVSLVNLPETAKGLLQGRPDDRWLVCVAGPTVADAPKIPCTEPHDWRAVTTIKLGEPDDPYPGDRLSEVRSRDFCSRSVQAYLNYPVQYDWGYTWFHEAEWDAGNRRSVCWARTKD